MQLADPVEMEEADETESPQKALNEVEVQAAPTTEPLLDSQREEKFNATTSSLNTVALMEEQET